MTTVKTSEAQRALGGIIRDAVASAAGKDGRVSKADQKKLPEFVDGVADKLRAKKGPGARVAAEELVNEAMSTAMRAWSKVNDRGARTLSKAELAELRQRNPALGELTDKAAEFSIKAKAPPTESALKPGDLSSSSKLGQLLEEKGTEWNDNNITNGGTTRIFGALVKLTSAPSTSQLEGLARSQFTSRLGEEDAKLAPGQTLQVRTGKLGTKVLAEIAQAAMKGYAYAPGNDEASDQLKQDVKLVARSVGKSADVSFAVARAKIEGGSMSDTTQDATLALLIDGKSGKTAGFWLVEGFM